MKKLVKKKKKGFTLVELLVVIAVLGIMAGIGLNSMSGITDIFRKRADDKTLDQVARTMQIRLMADDHKLLPASPSSELVYTTDIVPEMNLISQTTGELMIAKATGYKIFGNQNIAQDELNTNDLELYVTFYSDSADGKKHYRRSATISATYIHWDDENDNNSNGSGISHNSYFGSSSNLRFEGSEDFSNYWFSYDAPFSTKMDEVPEDDVWIYGSRIVFDPDGLSKIIESTDDENVKASARSQQEEREKLYQKTTPEDIMLSNLQVKNVVDGFYKKQKDGTIDDYVQNLIGNSQPIFGNTYELQIQDLDFVDPNNTLISPVTGESYQFLVNVPLEGQGQYGFTFNSTGDNRLTSQHSAYFRGDQIVWQTYTTDETMMP